MEHIRPIETKAPRSTSDRVEIEPDPAAQYHLLDPVEIELASRSTSLEVAPLNDRVDDPPNIQSPSCYKTRLSQSVHTVKRVVASRGTSPFMDASLRFARICKSGLPVLTKLKDGHIYDDAEFGTRLTHLARQKEKSQADYQPATCNNSNGAGERT